MTDTLVVDLVAQMVALEGLANSDCNLEWQTPIEKIMKFSVGVALWILGGITRWDHFVGIKQVVFGGEEYENWNENMTSEDSGFSVHKI
ncbi:hypothetical protein Ahy_B06g085570 isoform D [Arachis hypogaea]|uniref:Uncharacterized protein n=1 Tax=Arachis hypogaea TaxID=3818 RepID=A0A444YV39_ARAHY|nr:hypothetical protein Ahy_B06g085570 isoform D [Arachis hypogaea]